MAFRCLLDCVIIVSERAVECSWVIADIMYEKNYHHHLILRSYAGNMEDDFVGDYRIQ